MFRRVALALLVTTLSAPAFAADEAKPEAAPAADQAPTKTTHERSAPVAVSAALQRATQANLKALATDASGSEGTELAVTSRGGEVERASTSLAAVHGSTETHAAAVAGSARDVRMEVPKAPTAPVARPPATPRMLRRMNVERVVASLGPALDRCATTTDAGRARPAGTALLRASVAPNGTVEATEVVAAGGLSPEVLTCAEEAVRGSKLGAPGGAGASVVLPVHVGAARGD